MRSFGLFVLSLLISLTACVEQPQRVISPTQTSSIISLPTKAVFRPTQTVHPEWQISPLPTITPNPTVEALARKLLKEQYFFRTIISPDAQWVALQSDNDTFVIQINTEKVTKLACDLFPACTNVIPIRWSRDSRYLYFAPFSAIGVVPQGISYYSSIDKFNVVSGEVERLLPDLQDLVDPAYDFSVSPDEATLAYTRMTNNTVFFVLLDLNSGQEKGIAFSSTAVGGNIVWLPDSLGLTFQIKHKVHVGGYSVLFYDMQSGNYRELLSEEKGYIVLLSWEDKNRLLLEKLDDPFSGPNSYWYFNLSTNQIAPVPTIIP